jgi:hypothetical protein
VAGTDLTTCEQPDELIQLAWNAGLDKKAVIREGSDAARLLLAGERNELVTLFWPVPRPLEAVDRWSENRRSGISEEMRPFASAVVPGCLLGSLVARLFGGLAGLVLLIVAANIVLGLLFKVLIAAALRRRVARLDDETALAIVLGQLRRGMKANAARVPRAVTWIRRVLPPTKE